MSNILDKPMESMFGYISVLPGAFSAYRYTALLNTSPGHGPLASYFKGEAMHVEGSDSGLFAANMYLAEDRILCFEIVAKPNAKWILRYIKAARAETDVPDTVPEFISQRRRWLNGSFFAAAYALANWGRMFRTQHGISRKIGFFIQLLYNLFNLIFSWFSLVREHHYVGWPRTKPKFHQGTFYLAFYFIGQQLIGSSDPFGANSGIGEYVFPIARYIYLFAIVVIVISSIGNRPQASKGIYISCMAIFAILMIGMLAEAGYTVYSTVHAMMATNSFSSAHSFGSALLTNGPFRDIVISLVSVYGVYFLASFLFLDPAHMFTSFLQYLLL